MRKTSTIISNLIFIAVILLMPVVEAPTPKPTALLMFKNPYIWIDMFMHAFCMIYGYLNYFVLIPKLFARNRKLTYLFVISLFFILLSVLPRHLAALSFFSDEVEDVSATIHVLIQVRHVFYLFLAFTLLGLVSWAFERHNKIIVERSNAELKYLKAQIKPHFLFNTLNSIYAQMQTNVPLAGDTLIKLSNIMRYVLRISEVNEVPVAQEAQYIEEYIDLQRARFGATLTVDYTTNCKTEKKKIPPLLLISFVENAFKYGINPEGHTHITIALYYEDGELFLGVHNKKYKKGDTEIESTGTGIANTKSRLDLSFANRYQLLIKDTGKDYFVKLNIQL